MNSKNNGKIAIGILVMFVVALSIIGVTYAYFTATFNENQDTEDVKITAGELIATFDGTNSINVKNVVPGWASDGLHYYDVDVASKDNDKIYATKATQAYVKETDTKATTGKGLALPVAFNVENTSVAGEMDETIDFAIRLTVSQNSLETADQQNLYAIVYKGIYATGEGADVTYEDLSTKEVFAGPFVVPSSTTGSNVGIMVRDAIASGDNQDYYVVFVYKNDTGSVQPYGKTIQAKIDIFGIYKTDAEVTADTVWYDEDNNAVTFMTEVADESLDTFAELTAGEPLMCDATEAAAASNTCWNSTVE